MDYLARGLGCSLAFGSVPSRMGEGNGYPDRLHVREMVEQPQAGMHARIMVRAASIGAQQ